MTRYIIRRVLLTIPVLFGVLILVFFLNRVLPGSQCRALLGERATDAQCAAYDHLHGLDQPIPVQFGTYVASIAQGDFGVSVKTSQPVTTLLIERLRRGEPPEQTAAAQGLAATFEATFPLLGETPDIYLAWKAIVAALGVVWQAGA